MFELTLRFARSLRAVDQSPRCLVIHCSTRETRWLRYIAGKRDAKTGKPKGYRVEFAPGDGREFDAEGRPRHDERAALRQWSLVPKGVTAEARAKAERERLGMVPDLDAAREAVELDRTRAEAQVPAVKAGSLVMRNKTRNDIGLPKAPKHAAQLSMFDTRDAIDRASERRAAARAR